MNSVDESKVAAEIISPLVSKNKKGSKKGSSIKKGKAVTTEEPVDQHANELSISMLIKDALIDFARSHWNVDPSVIVVCDPVVSFFI